MLKKMKPRWAKYDPRDANDPTDPADPRFAGFELSWLPTGRSELAKAQASGGVSAASEALAGDTLVQQTFHEGDGWKGLTPAMILALTDNPEVFSEQDAVELAAELDKKSLSHVPYTWNNFLWLFNWSPAFQKRIEAIATEGNTLIKVTREIRKNA